MIIFSLQWTGKNKKKIVRLDKLLIIDNKKRICKCKLSVDGVCVCSGAKNIKRFIILLIIIVCFIFMLIFFLLLLFLDRESKKKKTMTVIFIVYAFRSFRKYIFCFLCWKFHNLDDLFIWNWKLLFFPRCFYCSFSLYYCVVVCYRI